MRYPHLVPSRLCKTDIKVTIYDEGLTEEGAPIKHPLKSLKCNYQDGGKKIFTAEQKLIDVSATCLFEGDPFSDVANIVNGVAEVNGIERSIIYGQKHRNPDGTINYTEIRLK